MPFGLRLARGGVPGWVLSALVLSAAPAAAQPTNWNVAGGGSWQAAGNWSAGVPTGSTTAVFATNPTAAAAIDLDGAATALGLQLTTPGGTVTIQNGTGTNTLTLGTGGIDMTTATQDLILGMTQAGVGASQTWDVRNGRDLTVNAGTEVALGANPLTLDTANTAGNRATVNLNGTITGTGGLTVTGAAPASGGGLVILGGSAANTFNGSINIRGGTLALNRASATASTAVNVSSNGQLRWNATFTNALPTTTALSLTGAALYNWTIVNADGTTANANSVAHTQTYASFTHNSSGTVGLGFGSQITVTGTYTGSGSGVVQVSSAARLQADTFDFSSAATGQIQLVGNSAATPSLLVVGPGGLSLNGRTVTLNSSGTTATAGSQIRLGGTLTNTGSTTITVTNAVAPFSLSVENATRTFNVANFMTLNVPVVDGGGAGAGGITKSGTGVMVMSRQSTYTGPTTVQQGTLRINTTEALPNGTAVTLAGGNLQNAPNTTSAGFSDTLGQLTVSETSTITLGTTSQTLTFASFDTLAAGRALNVVGWTGAAGTSGTNGKIVFTSGAGWDADELSRVQFATFGQGADLIAVAGGVELVPTLNPVPEPGFAVLVAAAGVGLWARRRAARRQPTMG